MTYTKNISSNFLTRILAIILNFLVSIFVARVLGPTGKGYAAYFLMIMSLFTIYNNFGLESATIYYQKKSIYKEQNIYNSNNSLMLILGILNAIVLIFLKKFNIFFTEYSWDLIFLGSIYLIIMSFKTCSKEFYIGNKKIFLLNRNIIISNVLKFLFILTFFLIGYLNSKNYIIIMLVNGIILTVLILKNQDYFKKFKLNLDFELYKKEFKYGGIFYLSALFIFLNYRVDQFMIKGILDTKSLGIYTIGVTLAELLFIIPSSIKSALIGEIINKNKLNERRDIISKTIKFTIYISFVLIIIGIFLTPLIPLVYGVDYIDSIDIVIILFWGVLFASIGKVGVSYLYSENKGRIHLLITSVTLIINLFLNYILIPRLGINGAAYASTISYGFYGSTYLFYLIKFGQFSLKNIFLIEKSEINFLIDIIKNKVNY